MRATASLAGVACGAILGACSGSPAPSAPALDVEAPISRAQDRAMVHVPAGSYIAGSTPEERARAYDTYRATAGHDAAREGRWFEREQERHPATLEAFRIDLTPVTNAAYAELVRTGAVPPPRVDREIWAAQGFSQDFDSEVARFNWTDDRPPPGREDHPVVLITWQEARQYCQWRGRVVGEPRRLPTADEYEKAARGDDGIVYPWGNEFDPDRLNSAVEGPRDTIAAGSFPSAASPYGMLDAAGNVFQWTASDWPHGEGEKVVKGSAWDDYGGVGRAASRHGRRADIRHAIIGFRCAAD